ncbi:carboxymuconolactone decarboxylase family protein [Streptomyces sp. NPDC008238]
MITTPAGAAADLGPDDLVPAHAPRMLLGKAAPDFYKAMIALDAAASAGLDPVISELVKARASQLNGCAYCVDMHIADARKLGLTEQKMHGLSVWWETPFYTVRERAALALVEAVTRLGQGGVPDEVYDEAARVFDEDELPRLIAMCVTINAWNRMGVTTRLSPAARPDGV